jgi:hypothetical protein
MTLRETLYERARGYCEKCGWPLGTNWAMHHRVLHSRVDDIRNVLALHHECHNLGSNSVHLRPEKAMEDGFIVRQPLDGSPIMAVLASTEQPILLHGKHWRLLTAEGTYADYIPKETPDGENA